MEFEVAVFMVRGILLRKSFLVVNTWQASVQKWLNQSTLNFTHTFLTDCCTKPCLSFPNSELFIIYCNNPKSFETCFAWKQSKVDYSKNIWKEGNHSHGFVCLLVGYISVKKIIENYNPVGAGAQKVGKVASFWPYLDTNFTDISRA